MYLQIPLWAPLTQKWVLLQTLRVEEKKNVIKSSWDMHIYFSDFPWLRHSCLVMLLILLLQRVIFEGNVTKQRACCPKCIEANILIITFEITKSFIAVLTSKERGGRAHICLPGLGFHWTLMSSGRISCLAEVLAGLVSTGGLWNLVICGWVW